MEMKAFESGFDATLVDFADGRAEHCPGAGTSFSARRGILVDDHRGNAWAATSTCPDAGGGTLTEIAG